MSEEEGIYQVGQSVDRTAYPPFVSSPGYAPFALEPSQSGDAETLRRDHGAAHRPSIEVFSYGGGRQSAGISALILQGRLPKPDIVIIADTEKEKGTTWQYLNEVVQPAFRKIGIEVIRVRNAEWASIPEHGKEWMSHNGNTVILPAFTNQTGEVGKLSAFCSARWKVEVVDRYLSQVLGITRSQYRKWIGYSLDEASRATRMLVSEEWCRGLLRLPLVIDVPMRKHQAIAEALRMGWPEPPRSACYMCPNQADDEWREIKENRPEEFAAACALEKEVQKVDPHAWFHKSCVPLAEVDFSTEPGLFDAGQYCSSGVCFT